MKCIIFNEDNLKENEMNQVVVRVKAFIMNSKNELLVASSNGGAQLVGGHVEEGEQYKDTLQREVLEETGIFLSSEEIPDPFYEVKHYTKNYHGKDMNRLSDVIYYLVRIDKKPNKDNANLTQMEQDYLFNVQYIPFSDFEDYIKDFLNNEKEINRGIASEILFAFEELKKNVSNE